MAKNWPFDYARLLTKEGQEMARNGRRLIEDYLPIQEVSAEASREKSIRKGHISSLHQWWARRPLVACRAAVYAALVPAHHFVPESTAPHSPSGTEQAGISPEDVLRGLNRDTAHRFITDLCRYPGDPATIAEAERQILASHAATLSLETGSQVSAEDILAGRAPRPRVLDMFAGGGSIPLEALRLGCEAYALDLNPVAHIIELCTVVYPQLYGPADATAKGSGKGGTWAGLAQEIAHWCKWAQERARIHIGDLYSPLGGSAPSRDTSPRQGTLWSTETARPPDALMPVAYLWTRTVRCKNASCGATIPLVRQTWLAKRKGSATALRVVAPPGQKRVRFELVEAASEAALGFDPAGFSKGGNATCPFCATVADADYVQVEGVAKRLGHQLMAVVSTRGKTKVYLAAPAEAEAGNLGSEGWTSGLDDRVRAFSTATGLTVPDETINPLRPSPNSRGLSPVTRYGMSTFADLFSARQLLCLLGFAHATRELIAHLEAEGIAPDRAKAVAAFTGLMTSTLADWNSTFTSWTSGGEFIGHTFTRHALGMVWDYAELNPFGNASGNMTDRLARTVAFIEQMAGASTRPAICQRGSALQLPWPDGSMDAVITDPPYYDNIPYADISDYFYVWLKRALGPVYPEHFTADLTPKKAEVTALASHHGGDMERANAQYEQKMLGALEQAARVLKKGGQLVVVYAHKTTLGWSTLVDSIRNAGFTVVEAWPLDTERASRMVAMEAAALASSIFIVARKRNGAGVGSYEDQVRSELEQIVRERVATLWKMGINGANLIIAGVGAGLRAFTQFRSVEYANGDPVPAVQFLREVEGVVHEVILEKLFSVARARVAAVDSPSRFYVLWRYTYGAADMDAGEAIVFTYGLDVELDNGLSTGAKALIQKKSASKTTYRLRDYCERGSVAKLGLPSDGGQAAPLVDILHRVLWLMENEPRTLPRFLAEATPDLERLRVVAQALSGVGLKGAEDEAQPGPTVTTTTKEQAALGKLLANWKPLIETSLPSGEGTLFDRKSSS